MKFTLVSGLMALGLSMGMFAIPAKARCDNGGNCGSHTSTAVKRVHVAHKIVKVAHAIHGT